MRQLKDIIEALLSHETPLSYDEALHIAQKANKEELYEAAHQVTHHFMGDTFDTCSIINVKSGHCSEDCHWCAQSGHYTTGAEVYPLLDSEPCIAETRMNRTAGIGRISLVASGRTQSPREMDRILELYRSMQQESDIKLCASLGLLSLPQLQALKAVGVTTYHCNMESAPSHFPKLCTTHTQEEKKQTIQWAREAGLQICSGGIIGMGETEEQRIEFAYYLRDLGVRSIPINILCPIPGTPLQNTPPLTDEEYLTTVALFRLINPRAFLRFSGGRAQLSPEVMRRAMYIGINSAITGDLLTTTGNQASEDMRLIEEMGYHNNNHIDWE